jgi:hypothetical protein
MSFRYALPQQKVPTAKANRYVPTSTELSSLIDQFLKEVSTVARGKILM